MKKILACALLLSFSAANGGWLLDKVKNAAKRVHNSSAATALRNKIKSGATKAVGYVKKQISGNFQLPYQIMSTVKNLRKATQAIENNYGGGKIAAATALIALCKECEAKPIKAMRSISDISKYIGEIEKLTDQNGFPVIPKESTDVLLGYMRDLNNLVYEYSLPYMSNIKKMLNEAETIRANAHRVNDISIDDEPTEKTENETTEVVRSIAGKLAKISDDCLKDTEYLEENINTMAMLISELQARGVDVTTLTTCLINLKNLIQSMNTLTKFNDAGENLKQTATNTVTNLQQTASMSATNLVNSANSAVNTAVSQSTELLNQGVQSTTEKLTYGVNSAVNYTQEAVNKSTEYLNDSASKLNDDLSDFNNNLQGYSNESNNNLQEYSKVNNEPPVNEDSNSGTTEPPAGEGLAEGNNEPPVSEDSNSGTTEPPAGEGLAEA